MKILWICNKEPTKINEIRNVNGNPTGGWLDLMCEDILNDKNNQLYVLFLSTFNVSGTKDNLYFCSFTNKNFKERMDNVLKNFNPEIIHIWGTEFNHTLMAITIVEKKGLLDKCILYIQGLVSLYSRHYTEGLPSKIIKSYTFRDFIRQDNILQAQKKFVKNGINEIKSIQKVKHIMGRTDWDHAAVQMFNPKAEYYICNETLRRSFYQRKWDIKTIRPHSIFVSQCSYPVKGFHYLLEAMPEILKCYPDAHIYTTGIDLCNLSLKQKLKITTYQNYLKRLIYNLNLRDRITFLGRLSEEEMCEQYIKSNVFVSASTIENSPNSLGEAMLVGCPVISSDVGGVKNMLIHGVEGFIYQSTAPYMLAYYVKEIFRNKDLAIRFSKNAKIHAVETHNRIENSKRLIRIYNTVIKSGF